jgi:hypothetical protein
MGGIDFVGTNLIGRASDNNAGREPNSRHPQFFRWIFAERSVGAVLLNRFRSAIVLISSSVTSSISFGKFFAFGV